MPFPIDGFQETWSVSWSCVIFILPTVQQIFTNSWHLYEFYSKLGDDDMATMA